MTATLDSPLAVSESTGFNLSSLLPAATATDALRRAAQAPGRTRLSVADPAKAYTVAALHRLSSRPVALVTARPAHARQLWEELNAWAGECLHFPAPDALPYEQIGEDRSFVEERVRVLARLQAEASAPLVVLAMRATLDHIQPPARFRAGFEQLRVGDRASPSELIQRWVSVGYEPTPLVDMPGQCGRRGGIVDVYPPGGQAHRIELFGDEIESIRVFDPETQRSGERVAELAIVPAADRPAADQDSGERRGGRATVATFFDYLPGNAIVVLDEPAQIDALARDLERQVEELRLQLQQSGAIPAGLHRLYTAWPNLRAALEASGRTLIEITHDPARESIQFSHAPAFGGRLRTFFDQVARPDRGRTTAVVSLQTARLQELLSERGVEVAPSLSVPSHALESGGLVLVHGSLPEGWQSVQLGITVYTDSELFGWRKIRRPLRRGRGAARDAFLSDLEAGELVVHVDHGIARYLGLVQRASAAEARVSTSREYLLLEYVGGDRLYVPIEQADRVTRYVGGGDDRPSLTRLGTTEWARAKARARRAVRDIAQELIDLYAARHVVQGHAFSADTTWQRELEDSFAYVETPDQVVAIDDVKRDMEQPVPMDRLLVGDVGYGKTEVALRSAFKAVMDGRQVAVLVPTTVLAQQHVTTFTERFGTFPVRVEMLSRFRSPQEQRQVVKALGDGAVDVCIGTHRLLSSDVKFKNLGLAIIDEEQRFGVAHKERLKRLRTDVDVLTMTATPIPRTMHMSLSGVRDMSVMQTAPEDRLPIRTYVAEFDEGLVREVILRELDRGGQVYMVHNRVQSIEVFASRLRRLIPEARFVIGHGQMPEEQLEQVMVEFANGLADVLLCTTIIESGLDIANVNTILVNNAHRFGLAQLYQLRGRVGRGSVRAYAYFLYARDTQLTEQAEQRLRTIFEATELGAGFRIAMKDLEIRGAGNLLGAEQSGQIAAVGFDLYSRLLGEAIELMRAARDGSPPPVVDATASDSRPSLDLPLDAFLSGEYVADEATRLNLYQRIAGIGSGEQLGQLIGELEDRFGPLPEAAQNLMLLVGLRLQAQEAGLSAISAMDDEMVLRFRTRPPTDVSNLSREIRVPLRVGTNQIRFPRGKGQAWLVPLQRLVDALAASRVRV